MDVPHLVRERLGDEPIEAAVNLGDEDAVCVTPTRTLVYRGEGLLSDEGVSEFPHDVEQFDVSEGRRKVKFSFEYVDGTRSFTVPGNRAEATLKLLLGGILRVAGVTDEGESISEVFTFSELTLVVTSDRLVKHVGAPVWDDDFEEYPYADVTGLAFEEGSVATQIVLSVDGRPERIKAPSEDAWKVEEALEGALCDYYDVDSLSALNEAIGGEDAGPEPSADDGSAGSLSLESGISPLVGDDGDEEGDTSTSESATEGGAASVAAEPAESEPEEAPASSGEPSVDTVTASPPDADAGGAIDPEDVEAIKSRVATLTEAVKRQNELLRDQQETIDQLIEELRRGR